jgi:hypothetical protein
MGFIYSSPFFKLIIFLKICKYSSEFDILSTITLNLFAEKKRIVWQRKLVPYDLSKKKIKIGILCFKGCIDFQQKWRTELKEGYTCIGV